MAVDVKKEFLKLLKEDEEFRYAVAGLIGLEEVLKAIKSLQEQVAGLQKQFVALQEQVASLQKQVAGLQKQFVTLQEEVSGLQKQVVKLSGTIAALGMRYGVLTEKVFRDAIQYLVEDLLKAYKVEKWTHYDKDGRVFNTPSIIEIDVFVRDKEHILVEYKAHIDRSDVTELFKIGELYAEVTGIKPKLLIVGPTATLRALKLAENLKVEIKTEYVFE